MVPTSPAPPTPTPALPDPGRTTHVLVLPLLVLAVALGIVYVLWHDATETAHKKRQADLDFLALEIADRIQDRMVGYDQLLHSLRGLFVGSQHVDRGEFRNFVGSLNLSGRYPGLSGLAFVPLVPDKRKTGHMASVRRDGLKNYTIRPEGRRAWYAPITYLEPYEGPNQRALGFDILSEPNRREALERSRDTDRVSITAKLALVQDEGKPPQVGFVMMLPLYKPGPSPLTVEERRSRLIGWVDAVFRAEALMQGILGKVSGQVDVEIFDGESEQSLLLYDEDKTYRAGGQSDSQFESRQRIEVGGRHWTLLVSSLSPFEQQMNRTRAQFIAQGGTVVSVLLALLTWILARSRVRSIESAVALRQELDARKQAEESLRLAAMVYDNASEGILVADADNHIIAVNPAFTRITGYEFDDVRGEDPKCLSSGRHDKEFFRDMWAQLNATGRWQGEIWDRRKNGEIHAKYLTINTIYANDGSVFRRVALFMDISEQKESEEYIWRQANFDSLTHLPNRRMFHDRLEQDIKKSQRAGLPLALLFIDLDLFKDVNDTLGHQIGDQLLVEAAKRIQACVREVDTVARLGGDEFMVILSELHDVDHVEQVAANILRTLDEPYHLGSEVVHVSGSIGVTLYPRDATEPEVLIRNADQAMYVAKNTGRQRFSYFTPALQEAAQTRLRLVNDLRSAIAESHLNVHYQPIVDLKTGGIYKAEALVRWPHVARGWISPGEFIFLAEEAGLVGKIGDQVFDRVVQDVHRLRQTSHPGFQVSVNTSPRQFREKNNSPLVWFEKLRNLRLPGECITIEITEGLLLNASPEVTERLQAYRSSGMQIAIDDFGVGYSSLAYLKRFDIDYLKIDKSFVRDIETDANDKALSQAIIVMAHALGLKVIAEGVETASQLRFLREMGCDYAQGYLFSEAVPMDQFEALLRNFAWNPDGHPEAMKKF